MFAINSIDCNVSRTRFDLQGASGGKPASSRRFLSGNLCSKEVWPRAKASTSRTITGRRVRCVTLRVQVGLRGICALVRASVDVCSHTTIASQVKRDRSDSGRGRQSVGLGCTLSRRTRVPVSPFRPSIVFHPSDGYITSLTIPTTCTCLGPPRFATDSPRCRTTSLQYADITAPSRSLQDPSCTKGTSAMRGRVACLRCNDVMRYVACPRQYAETEVSEVSRYARHEAGTAPGP